VDNDDRQIGRILSRREVLAIFGAAGASLLVGCGAAPEPAVSPTSAATSATASGSAATPAISQEAQQQAEVTTADVAGATTTAPACVVRPEVTEGPYYVEENLVRSDIREDRAGALLQLTFNVSQVGSGGCTPLQGATVDIWHCDAAGQYSDVSDPGFNTKGQTWLRGSQVTDANGQATFMTIYPGWYSSRAVHIHFKIHPNDTQVFTSQLFFDDSLSDQVFSQAPYASKGQRDTLNSNDNIYQDTLLLTVAKTDQGYAATFPIGIDVSTLGTGESQNGGPGGGPPPGGPGGPPPNGAQQPSATSQSSG
jgi:protocatechuate 3,4-dioxygenase beta subunit